MTEPINGRMEMLKHLLGKNVVTVLLDTAVLGDVSGIPAPVVEMYKGRGLPLIFKPEDPFDPTFEEAGLGVLLMFGPTECRCLLPWDAISMITGFFPTLKPEDVKRPTPKRPALRVV